MFVCLPPPRYTERQVYLMSCPSALGSGALWKVKDKCAPRMNEEGDRENLQRISQSKMAKIHDARKSRKGEITRFLDFWFGY